jgi:hypothetical protein
MRLMRTANGLICSIDRDPLFAIICHKWIETQRVLRPAARLWQWPRPPGGLRRGGRAERARLTANGPTGVSVSTK